MSKLYAAASVAGAAVTANAIRPIPAKWTAGLTSFGGWLTSELAPQLLTVHAATTVGVAARGMGRTRWGRAGLAANVATGVGLAALVWEGHRARDILEESLCRGLGPDYRDRILESRSADYDLRVPWRQLLQPFHQAHPEVEHVRDISYGPYGRRNSLDIYHRRDRPSGAPVLMQIHGGAWSFGDKNQQGKPLMLHMASRGWVCVAPNYRLSPRSTFPDHLVDVKRALAWIRKHGPEYGADPSFVLVTGGSAGGHLTAMAALTQNDPRYQPDFEDADTSVQAAVPYYGVYDFTNELGHPVARERMRFLEHVVVKGSIGRDRRPFEEASPLYRLTEDAPPFFVIHGEHDSLVPAIEAHNFVGRLSEVSRSPVCYVEIPGAQHAFDVFPSIRTAHVVRAVERFADYAYCRARDRASVQTGGGGNATPNSPM